MIAKYLFFILLIVNCVESSRPSSVVRNFLLYGITSEIQSSALAGEGISFITMPLAKDNVRGGVINQKGCSPTPSSTDGSLDEARFNFPTGIVADEKNLILYIADTGNHTIRKTDLKINQVTTIAGIAGQAGTEDGVFGISKLNEPRGLEIIYPFLYIADSENHAIRRLNLITNQLITIVGKAGEEGAVD